MIAHDVMTDKVLSVTSDMTLRQIARTLLENRISGVPVVDGDGAPIGLVSEKDLIGPATGKCAQQDGQQWWLTRLAEGEPLNAQFLTDLIQPERTARDVMSSPVISVQETTEISEVARLLIEHQVKRLLVVRDGRIVGIVSRTDLIRQMARSEAPAPTASLQPGLMSQALALLDDRFNQPPAALPADIKEKKPDAMTMTAGELSALAEDFSVQAARQLATDQLAGANQRKAQVLDMAATHVQDEAWQTILRRAQSAAEAGKKELLLLRFPSELCSDGGRAINAPQENWPETLQGEAAEIYHLWERDLKPTGFRLSAQVLDFPGGMPGDIGLNLVWGGGQPGPKTS